MQHHGSTIVKGTVKIGLKPPSDVSRIATDPRQTPQEVSEQRVGQAAGRLGFWEEIGATETSRDIQDDEVRASELSRKYVCTR